MVQAVVVIVVIVVRKKLPSQNRLDLFFIFSRFVIVFVCLFVFFYNSLLSEIMPFTFFIYIFVLLFFFAHDC